MGFGQSEEQKQRAEPEEGLGALREVVKSHTEFLKVLKKGHDLDGDLFKGHGDSLRDLNACVQGLQTSLTDAERCIKGQAEELSKTNARLDALVADREKHQKRLDDRLEQVIEATQEAETAFLNRIARAEKRAEGYAKRNATLVGELSESRKGNQD